MAAVAASQPAVVSWSVRANVVTPASTARRTRSAGPSVPSDAFECRWRSITTAMVSGSGGGLALLPEDQLGDRLVDLFGVGEEGDAAQRLDLPGGLDDHRPVAQHAAVERPLEGQVGDLAERHHADPLGEDALGEHDALVGDDDLL